MRPAARVAFLKLFLALAQVIGDESYFHLLYMQGIYIFNITQIMKRY